MVLFIPFTQNLLVTEETGRARKGVYNSNSMWRTGTFLRISKKTAIPFGWTSINVFELYRVLEKAIEDYLDELRHDEVLQDKFIMAWSSIEDYMDKVDSNQSDEIKALQDYLGSNSDAPVLQGLNRTINMDMLRIYSYPLKIRRM